MTTVKTPIHAFDAGSAPQTNLSTIWDIGFVPSWGLLSADDLEQNDEMRFPQSIVNFQKMLDTDSQIQGLAHGSTWPLYRMRWFLKTGDANAEWVDRTATDLGLPVDDAELPQRRSRNRFNFDEFLAEALDACFHGFKIFEQVAPVGEDGWVHLKKLLNIPQLSITEVNQDLDGSMNWIRQLGYERPNLPIDRLVWFAFQKRGANWTGKSLLRGCYGPWLLKDRAMRIGVMNLQRAGVGTPVIEAPPGASDAELIVLNRLAERWNGNQKSGGVVPAGGKLRLVGVEGSQPDALGFIKLMNEEMARAFLQMFILAGQTGTGSRSTTESWIDWHKLTLEYVANWVAKIFSQHVIEDIWDWNYGPEVEEVPTLAWEWDEEGSDANPQGPQAAADPAAQLRQQVNSGEVQAPDEVAAWLNAEPGSTSSDRRPVDRRPGRQARAAGANSTAAPPLSLPSRALRRQPYAHEITAAVDYAALDSSYQSSLDLLVQEVRMLQAHQVAALHDAIIDADGDMVKLSELDAEPMSADVILSRLQQVANLAADHHIAEANRQGVSVPKPDMEKLNPILTNRSEAVDHILSRDLAQRAGRDSVRLSGGSLTPSQVADQVKANLSARSDSYLRDILGGGVQSAINDGRGLVMRQANPQMIYASEILDVNTCELCTGVDGTQYLTMDDAAADYPSGGFRDCLGRDRCRGVLVAIYDEGGAN
jgi:hypothetical protein